MIGSIPIVVTTSVPLTHWKRDPETNELHEVETLYEVFGGKMYVHPDRMPLIEAAIAAQEST